MSFVAAALAARDAAAASCPVESRMAIPVETGPPRTAPPVA